MIERYTAPDEKWRTIENEWLLYAEEIAVRLWNTVNNLSLVLAFELVNSGEVLLFPEDAQVADWLSWQAWSRNGKAGSGEKISAKDLLERTVYYKVANHGSQNAFTESGLDAMTCPALVAAIPVDEAFAHKLGFEMPAPALYSRLLDKTRGRLLRPDFDGSTATDPRNPPAHQTLPERVHVSPLYVDYYVQPSRPPAPTPSEHRGSCTGTARPADGRQSAVSQKERATDGSRLTPENANDALERAMKAIKKPKRAEREYDNIDRFVLVFHNQLVEMMSKYSAIIATEFRTKLIRAAFSGKNWRAFDFWSDEDEWASIEGGDNFSYQLLFNPPYFAKWDMLSHSICYVQAYYHEENRIKEIIPEINAFADLCHTHLPGFSIQLSEEHYIPYQKLYYDLNAEFLKRCLGASRELVLGMNAIHREILVAPGSKRRRK